MVLASVSLIAVSTNASAAPTTTRRSFSGGSASASTVIKGEKNSTTEIVDSENHDRARMDANAAVENAKTTSTSHTARKTQSRSFSGGGQTASLAQKTKDAQGSN